jgi:hypothetical protein
VGGGYASGPYYWLTWTQRTTLEVADGVTLTLEPGAVVKFMVGRRLAMRGAFVSKGTSDRHVVLTSWYDDTIGGATSHGDAEFGRPTEPMADDWGLVVDYGSNTQIGDTELRYMAPVSIGNIPAELTNNTYSFDEPHVTNLLQARCLFKTDGTTEQMQACATSFRSCLASSAQVLEAVWNVEWNLVTFIVNAGQYLQNVLDLLRGKLTASSPGVVSDFNDYWKLLSGLKGMYSNCGLSSA